LKTLDDFELALGVDPAFVEGCRARTHARAPGLEPCSRWGIHKMARENMGLGGRWIKTFILPCSFSPYLLPHCSFSASPLPPLCILPASSLHRFLHRFGRSIAGRWHTHDCEHVRPEHVQRAEADEDGLKMVGVGHSQDRKRDETWQSEGSSVGAWKRPGESAWQELAEIRSHWGSDES
jgi:hypothetical protein